MRKQQMLGLVALIFALGTAVYWLGAPPATFGQNVSTPAAGRVSDLCETLPAPSGRAEGIDKRCRGGSSNGVARGDFNGDGFADLAIGAPGKDTPANVASSGAVFVIYGSANGLLPSGGGGIPATQFWSQNSQGVPDTSEAGDNFGSALAAGEFNGDNFSDLAIGVDGEDFDGLDDVGRVIVIYGSPNGLTATDTSVPASRAFDLRDAGVALNLFGDEATGSALAWGFFNDDQFADLAIGAPGYSFPASGGGVAFKAGGVMILFGSAGGLTTNGQQLWTQDSGGVQGSGEDADHFGEVLVGGDFNGDGRTDLAIGAPGEDFNGVEDVGVVHVLFGAAAGLSATSDRLFSEDDFLNNPNFIGTPAPDDEFGTSMAAGDFDGDGKVDLAVGTPRRTIGTADEAGIVFIYSSSNVAGVLGVRRVLDQGQLFNGAREDFDKFGFALAAGDFNADGFADLAVGVPFEDVVAGNGQNLVNAGEVNVIRGSNTGLVVAVGSAQVFRQGTAGVQGTLEAEDRFGTSLSAWNFGRNEDRVLGNPPRKVTFRSADLAIGAPNEDIVNANGTISEDAGNVIVLYGSIDNGLTATGNQQFFQANIGGFADVAFDRFGRFLY